MYPLLFELGPLSIYSYGVLLATAYIVGLQFALRRADRAGLSGQRVMDLGIFVIISALIGAKLMLFLLDGHGDPRLLARRHNNLVLSEQHNRACWARGRLAPTFRRGG